MQCSADTFVVNQSLVLRINICGKNRHLRQAAKRCKQPLPTFYKICFGNLNFSTLFCQRFVAAHTAAAQSQTQSKAAVRAATPTHNRADYNTISSCAKREQQNFFKHIQYVRIEGHFAFVDPKKK